MAAFIVSMTNWERKSKNVWNSRCWKKNLWMKFRFRKLLFYVNYVSGFMSFCRSGAFYLMVFYLNFSFHLAYYTCNITLVSAFSFHGASAFSINFLHYLVSCSILRKEEWMQIKTTHTSPNTTPCHEYLIVDGLNISENGLYESVRDRESWKLVAMQHTPTYIHNFNKYTRIWTMLTAMATDNASDNWIE